MSSCCGGNCGCGSDCKCGSGCKGCKMYPDMSYAETSSGETLVMGVAAPEGREKVEGGEMGAAGVDNGCKCGSNCTCDPCTCNECREKMEGGEMSVAGADNGCKCGSNCTCDPCTCNK